MMILSRVSRRQKRTRPEYLSFTQKEDNKFWLGYQPTPKEVVKPGRKDKLEKVLLERDLRNTTP